MYPPVHDTSSPALLSFHHPRRPHTWQLRIAAFATLIYASAVGGLASLHNIPAASGWACATILSLFWTLLLLRENKWRRVEQLSSDAQDEHDQEQSHPTFESVAMGTAGDPLPTHHSTDTRSHPLIYPQQSDQGHDLDSHPQSPIMDPSRFDRYPLFLSTCGIGCVVTIAVAMLATSIFWFIYAGNHGERLNKTSHWLAGISYFAASKTAVQLAWRQKKARRTFISVTTFLRESYTPMP